MERVLAGVVVFVGAMLAIFWPHVAQLGADAVKDETALFIEERDVARGGTIDATVRVAGDTLARIAAVTITGAGEPRVIEGTTPMWGDTIDAKVSTVGSDSLAFTIDVPESAERLQLEIVVESVTAIAGGGSFINSEHTRTFTRDIPVYSPGTSTLRRVGRGGIALGACVLVVVVLVAGKRWSRRRGGTPSNAWGLLVFPYAALGVFVFYSQVSGALRIHGLPFAIACLVAWFAVLAIPTLLTKRYAMTRYVVNPVGAGTCPAVSLEGAWIAAGLTVAQKRRHYEVSFNEAEPAIVTIPASETFGGEPFEILARDRNIVFAMLDAAAPLLGELRCVVDGEELRVAATVRAS